MHPERRNQISDLFHAALERAPEERPAFLEQACDGDRALRQEIESLLRHDSDGAAFLETPVMKVAGGEASRAGQQLGPYRILGPLGAGGMGEVYRARDSKLGREVAIKMLAPLFTADPERRARFAREARLLATLNHPHIGAIYGLEDLEGQTALVLELVEGATLAKRLEGGPLPIGEALAVARQVADALDAAHQKNIIHRDLKPANIVLQGGTSGEPRVKVLDFGLATTGIGDAVDSEQVSMTNQRTEAGRILGTPAYMSPEQARGQIVDKRTDVWAFGCVLFEMLTGKSPFGGETITDTLARILEREPEWPALPTETPAPIRTLLRRCLTKDPDKRLHDIADARIEIDDRDRSLAPSVVTSQQRGRLLKWIAATAVIAASSVAVPFLWFRPSAPAAASVVFAIPPPDKSTFGIGSDRFAVSPDGRQLALIAYSDTRPRLWVRPLGTLGYREIPGTDGAGSPFWKPDSLEIGFIAGGKLKTVRLSGGGVPFEVTDAPIANDGGATWNHDDVIVFMSRDGTLQKTSANGKGALTTVTTLEQGDIAHRWPSFLPDGQHFLFYAQQADHGELRLGSLDVTSTTSLGPSDSNALYAADHLFFLSEGQLVARRFDGTTRKMTGDPVPVAPMPKFRGTLGHGAFSATDAGVLAYYQVPASDEARLTWRDRTGTPVGTVG